MVVLPIMQDANAISENKSLPSWVNLDTSLNKLCSRNSYNRIAKSEFKKLIGQSVDAAERAVAGL